MWQIVAEDQNWKYNINIVLFLTPKDKRMKGVMESLQIIKILKQLRLSVGCFEKSCVTLSDKYVYYSPFLAHRNNQLARYAKQEHHIL